MSKLRWGVSAIAALLFAGASVQADDLSTMKSTMEEMRSELATLRSQMQAQEEQVRSYAGGAPEALRSRNGKAALKIGGRIRSRYRSTWAANDNDQPNYRRYRDRFDLRSARLDFQADFTPDTTAFLRIRLERADGAAATRHNFIDEAWWQWRNICGTGINLRVGKMGMPFGKQYNGGALPLDSWNDRGFDGHIANGVSGGMNNPAGLAEVPGWIGATGIEASYKMGDFTIKAGVFDGSVRTLGGGGGYTPKNNPQYSAIVNTAIQIDWEPSMVEGLVLSGSYLGVHNYADDAAGAWNPTGNYSPAFNLAASYTCGAFNFFFENTMAWNASRMNNGTTNIYGDAFANTLTAGARYDYSEKLAFTGMFDWAWLSTPQNRGWNTPGHGRVNAFRATAGAQYDFGNGIILQASYSHIWSTWSVENRTRHTDEVVIQSVVSF